MLGKKLPHWRSWVRICRDASRVCVDLEFGIARRVCLIQGCVLMSVCRDRGKKGLSASSKCAGAPLVQQPWKPSSATRL